MASSRIAVDRGRAVKAREGALQLLDRARRRDARAAVELKTLHPLQRKLPASAGVFERPDLDLERTRLRSNRRDRDRRPPRVQQSASVALDEVPELAGREVRVRFRIGVGFVDVRAHG